MAGTNWENNIFWCVEHLKKWEVKKKSWEYQTNNERGDPSGLTKNFKGYLLIYNPFYGL